MILNPWNDYPQKPPFILPMDAEIVNTHNSKLNNNQNHKHFFDLRFFAEPYVGDRNAAIYILNHNPGISENHNNQMMENPELQNIINNNLIHNNLENPFYIIHQNLQAIHPIGYNWWCKKLRQLLEEFDVQFISNNIFNLELNPYHSRNFYFLNLPSLAYNKQLLLQAKDENKLIILLRKGYWNRIDPEIDNYPNLITLNSPQAATISSGNINKFQIIRQQLLKIKGY